MGWTEDKNGLHKVFEFKDFKSAFDFMSQVAKVADKMNHHPDWSNSYNKVSIRLFSHREGKVTATDKELATRIDSIAENYL